MSGGQETSVMDAIQMLGANTFSTSFIERMIEQTEEKAQQKMDLANLMCPEMYPLLSPEVQSQEPMMWIPQQPNFWEQHSSSANLMSQNTLGSQEISKKTKSSNETSNRRKTLQHAIFCSDCHRPLGIAFIRGDYRQDTDIPLQIRCGRCQNSSGAHHIDPVALEGRKRRRRESRNIECEVCHLKIGNGVIEALNQADLKVEYVCTDCGDKYMFCSECGGGGKQRTGKWRPKELFEQGRRTCSLPHIRVGNAEVHYKVIRVEDLTADVLQGIQDVFFDCLLSLYCVPSIMTNHRYGTFDVVKREIERLWLTSVLDVLTNNVLHGKKYVTVAWIHKRHRNKGVGRTNPSKELTPWLQRLGLSGIISPPRNAGKPDSEEKHHCFVAFSIAEWDVINKSIFLAQMAPRSVFLKTMDGYHDLIRNCIEKIKADAQATLAAKPAHIWCWAKADHARLQSIPIRLKFLPRSDYLAMNPMVDSSVFERDNYEPLMLDGTLVYVAGTKSFLGK